MLEFIIYLFRIKPKPTFRIVWVSDEYYLIEKYSLYSGWSRACEYTGAYAGGFPTIEDAKAYLAKLKNPVVYQD